MLDYLFQLYTLFQFKGFLKEAILILLVATLLLFIVMIFQKLMTEWEDRRITDAKHYYLSACYRFLQDHSSPVSAPKSRLEVMAAADVVIYLLAESDREKSVHLQNLAAKLQLPEKLCRQATARGSWVSRLLAVEKMGFLKLPATAPVYRSLLDREQEPHIIAKLLWALSQIATVSDVAIINRVLRSHPVFSGKFNEMIYGNIISTFTDRNEEAEALQLLKDMLADQQLALLLKRDLIEACGTVQFKSSMPLLRNTYHHFSGEAPMKIACLRALGVMAGDSKGELTLPALKDPDWRVRAVAARYAVFAGEGITPSLTALLGDSNYHVRINAAQSLGAISDEGRGVLYQQLTSSDRFVRDVCAYVLEGV